MKILKSQFKCRLSIDYINNVQTKKKPHISNSFQRNFNSETRKCKMQPQQVLTEPQECLYCKKPTAWLIFTWVIVQWPWHIPNSSAGGDIMSRVVAKLTHCGLATPYIWRHRSGSTLAQVMACCPTAPSHYLNQCWLIICEVLHHSPEVSSAGNAHESNHYNAFENYLFKIKVTIPMGQWVKLMCTHNMIMVISSQNKVFILPVNITPGRLMKATAVTLIQHGGRASLRNKIASVDG